MNPDNRRFSEMEAEAQAEVKAALEKEEGENKKQAKAAKNTKKLIKETKNMLLGITPSASSGKFSKKEFKAAFKQRKTESLKTGSTAEAGAETGPQMNAQITESGTFEFERLQHEALKTHGRKQAALEILKRLELI